MTSISFLFPSRGSQPSGGLKVVCEYANRLASDGCEVHIVYAGSVFWKEKTLYHKLTGCVRYMQQQYEGYSCRKWFHLDERVREHFAFSLNYRHVPHTDMYVATSPLTAMYLRDYPLAPARKYYFIQGYENWGGLSDAALRATYHYPMQVIVISQWLKGVMEEEGVDCKVIPNGFDFSYFGRVVPTANKDRYRVTMLNHFMERKGCRYGFEALAIVKKKFPQLRVNLFGVDKRPADLPEWYDYYQNPDKETLNRIYNEAALFLGTSNMEGFGLTIGEAMMCGAAVVCTDNPGYREMSIQGETALLSPIKDAQQLADNMIRLIKDDSLRCSIAENGHRYIQQFTWDRSHALMRKALHI